MYTKSSKVSLVKICWINCRTFQAKDGGFLAISSFSRSSPLWGRGCHDSGKAALCFVPSRKSLQAGVIFLGSYRYAVNVTNIVQIKSDCYEQFRKSKFIQRHVSVDRFLTCGHTCNRVTSKKLSASVALKIRKRLWIYSSKYFKIKIQPLNCVVVNYVIYKVCSQLTV